MLFEEGVGLGEDEVVGIFGGRETVDGPCGVVEEGVVPMNVPDGPSVFGRLVFVRVGGMLFEALHSGLPTESRKQVYPGARSPKLSRINQTMSRECAYGSRRSLQCRRRNQG